MLPCVHVHMYRFLKDVLWDVRDVEELCYGNRLKLCELLGISQLQIYCNLARFHDEIIKCAFFYLFHVEQFHECGGTKEEEKLFIKTNAWKLLCFLQISFEYSVGGH